MKKTHVGIAAIVVMSAKGTATLAATWLLPTWTLRLVALAIIAAIGAFVIVQHRRKRKYAERSRGAE